jgi:hypothetical protein
MHHREIVELIVDSANMTECHLERVTKGRISSTGMTVVKRIDLVAS